MHVARGYDAYHFALCSRCECYVQESAHFRFPQRKPERCGDHDEEVKRGEVVLISVQSLRLGPIR